jgi:hypothetical protein
MSINLITIEEMDKWPGHMQINKMDQEVIDNLNRPIKQN